MNQFFMKKAIEQAIDSGNDVPVGAVLVKDNDIIAVASNKKELLSDVTMHAEIIVLREAFSKLNTWHLEGFDLYVTLEPCPMCAWAVIQARVSNVYFGSFDSLYGALGSKIDLRNISGSKLDVKGGILQDECDELMRKFFKEKRC